VCRSGIANICRDTTGGDICDYPGEDYAGDNHASDDDRNTDSLWE